MCRFFQIYNEGSGLKSEFSLGMLRCRRGTTLPKKMFSTSAHSALGDLSWSSFFFFNPSESPGFIKGSQVHPLSTDGPGNKGRSKGSTRK